MVVRPQANRQAGSPHSAVEVSERQRFQWEHATWAQALRKEIEGSREAFVNSGGQGGCWLGQRPRAVGLRGQGTDC